MKELDLRKTVNDLIEEYPELLEALKEVGFKAIANPVARRTLGRVTTIPGACKIHKKDLNEVLNVFREKGFEITGLQE